MFGDNHLGNSFAGLNFEGLVTVIDQEYFDFAAVIGIDGARAI